MTLPKIKFCGITREEDAVLAAQLGVDFIGMIFAKSERQVSTRQAVKIVSRVGRKCIGVFVNESLETLLQTVDRVGLSGVQLHGDEDSEYINSIKALRPQLTVIKAVELKEEFIGDQALHLGCDYLLFDSPRQVPRRKPLEIGRLVGLELRQRSFIAGLLSPLNVCEYVETLQPYAMDVSSGIELRPGIKCPETMRLFVSAVSRSRL
jgi:phosphoribosylanthranilate isomerase